VTGLVVLAEQGTPLATVPLSGGTATFSISALPPGEHTLNASYVGDANHSTSSSSAMTLNLGTANERFVTQLYVTLLQRQPEAAGLASWVGDLDHGVSRAQVVRGFEQSLEWRTDQVEALYHQFLNRDADPSGLDTYVHYLGMGGTVEQLKIILTSSPEYFMVRGGGTNEGFLTALYQDALNRQPDTDGLASFEAGLNGGTSRQQVATAIFGSPEYYQDLMGSFYQRFLNRLPDDAGLQSFVAELQAGVASEDIIAAMLGSGEFFSHA
jgi:hypothetical protein